MTLTPKPVDLTGSAGFGVPGVGDAPLWIVSDDIVGPGPLPPDHVMGVGGATTTLLRITPRHNVDTALDLGCGSGVGALLLSHHARTVVASDTSARALAATSLTLQRNGAGPALLVRGSLTDPFADDTFDLVVADPPFVITPHPRHDYRDTPLPGDSLAPALLAGLDRILRRGGWAVVLASWIHQTGADWTDRVAGWFPPGAAVWAAQRQLVEPEDYVDFWLRDAGQGADDGQRRAWLDHLRGLSAEAVGLGWLVLHKPTDPGSAQPRWVEDVSTASRVPSGDEVLAEFARRRGLPDATSVLQASPRAADAVTVTAATFDGLAGGNSQAVVLSVPDGWRAPEPLDGPMSWWFSQTRDRATGARMAHDLPRCAQDTGFDPADILVSWLTGVRDLMGKGFATLDASPSGCTQ